MADNKYRKYLNGEESPRHSSLLDVTGGIIKTAVGAAALIGGGAAVLYGAKKGLKYLDGEGLLSKGINKISKGASYLDGYLTGLNKTFKQNGVFSTLMGEVQDELTANLTESMRPYAVRELREQAGKVGLGGETTRLEKVYGQLNRIRRQTADRTINSVKLEKVLEDVRQKDWARNNPELLKSVEDMLSKDKFVLKAGFERDYDIRISGGKTYKKETVIERALENAIERSNIYNKYDHIPAAKKNSGDMAKDIKEILLKYSDKRQFVRDNRDVISSRVKKIKDAQDSAFLDYINRQTLASKAALKSLPEGYKQLTFGEAIKMGYFDYSSLVTKSAKGSGIETKMMRPHILKDMPGLENMPLDPLVFINKSGQVADLRFGRDIANKITTGLSNSVQIPLIGIKPLRLLTVFNREAMDRMPSHVFKRENIKSVLGFIGKNLPEDDYFFAGGKVLNSKGEVIDDSFRLASSKFGLFQREAASMAGYSKYAGKERDFSILKDIFGIGEQEYPSALGRKLSGITKFKDIDWERNIWYNVTDKTKNLASDKVYLEKAYGKFMNTVDNMTRGMSRETLAAFKDYIVPSVGEDTYNALMQGTKEEGAIRAIFKMLQDGSARDSTSNEFSSIMRRYLDDPNSFDRIIRTSRRGYQADLPDFLETAVINNVDLISNMDQAEKLLHMELLNQAQSTGGTVDKMVKDLLSAGKITKKQANEVLDLYVLNDLRNVGAKGALQSHDTFAGLLQQPKGEAQQAIHEHLRSMIFQANPKFGVGPGSKPESFFPGEEFIPVREGRVFFRVKDFITNINEASKQGQGLDYFFDNIGTLAGETFGEMGFGTKKYRAGRDNLDKVTTTSYRWYHYGYRLNEGLSTIGLGLSTKDLGSTQDIWKNLLLKRILAPTAVLGGLAYLNFEAGEITGEKPTQTVGRMYAQMTMDMAGVKDITGLNGMGKWLNRTFPGFNLLNENPIGMALKFGTFGMLGETRSYGEMQDYYEKGYDPIRKGRFWSWGSNTPFYGGRIDYFAPSWYRQMMGEPQFTDALYGSEAEYWANTWLPNPRNLFGLKPLIDPYHWENKHKEDRPYPVTGGTAFRQIPIVGPLIDMPLSAVLKPTRKYPGLGRAHEEYLREINEGYKSFIAEANRGAMIQIYPGGRITPVSYTDEGATGGLGSGGGNGVGGFIQVGDQTVAVMNANSIGSGTGRGSAMATSQLSYMNQSYVSYANVKPIDGRSIQLLRDHAFVDSLDQAMDPSSLAYRLGETAYSITEIGGMYGFLANTFFGIEDAMAPRVQLQDSARMTSLERSFWDKGLGGLGGELSEIYRRFLPHKRNQIKEYNPLQNTMPSWMPGLDYFIDFKHGDPYLKVPQGEGRLPGPGYESMNKLHSDPWFGRYGALDRFKILADVAPWSEQFRYYNSVVSKMHGEGLIAPNDYKDVQMMRDMVKQRKEKYDLYSYRYRYADEIDKKTVTVDKMLDPVTFLSKEMPGSPIRLAGIKLPSKEDPDYESIINDLSKHLSPGKRVRIGIESDALNRVRDDTMGTMSAVLYHGTSSVQRDLVRRYSGITADYEDTSATAVNSLYSGSQITLGKVWEAFAHLDTPIHTKFLKVRSPIEHYERQMVYGKDWQSWSHPFRDWIGPMVDKWSSGSPIISTLVGAGVGSIFGANKTAKELGAIFGGIVGGMGPSIRSLREAGGRLLGDDDYTWIPQRRRQEREIEEYFDMLKYVKYKGLYEKAREMAISNEGVDPSALSAYAEAQGDNTKSSRRKLEGIKRWLKLYEGADPDGKDNLKEVNRRLTELDNNKILVNAGPYAMRALQYKAEYEATLYGADPYGDLQVIYRALPKKDRPFFTKFMTAPPEEREKILRLVPENQKRFYQAKWGLKVDNKKSLDAYFAKHNLPSPDWKGWDPGVSLEGVKVKFVQNTALDIGEFGFWPDDIDYARGAPEISGPRKNPMFGLLDIAKLKKVLAGAGISDADIQIVTEIAEEDGDLFNVNVDMSYDRRDDVNSAINDNLAYLV